MPKSNLIISEPTKPLINRIVVSLLYTFLFGYTLYLFIYKNLINDPDKWTVLILLSILLFVLFSSTFMLIASHSIHLDFQNRKIQHQYRVGLFNYKEVWQDLTELKYISVFNQDGYFQINMWYKKNDRLNLMVLEDSDKALKNGLLIAEKLNIGLLDARQRDQHKWVNKKVFKETDQVQYVD